MPGEFTQRARPSLDRRLADRLGRQLLAQSPGAALRLKARHRPATLSWLGITTAKLG
jgi:hypothetical protein